MVGMEGMKPRDEPKQAASTAAREAYFVELATALMQARTPPLLVTGGFRSRAAMEAALASGIAMVGVGRPLCAAPDCVAELLAGRIDALPRFEDDLAIGPAWLRGILGPHSPVKTLRALNAFAAQAWYYTQIRRLAAGAPVERDLGPMRAFLMEDRENKARIPV
jgi:hypothetical protein